jgi:hypothetical protein
VRRDRDTRQLPPDTVNAAFDSVDADARRLLVPEYTPLHARIVAESHTPNEARYTLAYRKWLVSIRIGSFGWKRRDLSAGAYVSADIVDRTRLKPLRRWHRLVPPTSVGPSGEVRSFAQLMRRLTRALYSRRDVQDLARSLWP